MKIVVVSKNLLGDGLNISPALRALVKANPHIQFDVATNDDAIKEIYSRMGVDVGVITNGWRYDGLVDFDVSEAFALGHKNGWHITKCFAEMVGVKTDENCPTFITTEEEHEKDLILISPFSKSCSSNEGLPPNKMLPWAKVGVLLDFFRSYGKVGILGAENDRAPIEASEDEYYTGLPLNKVALMLRDCKLLFTIDNGISHLAASQQANSVVIYPACLSPHWIAPIGNKNALIIQCNPVTVQVASLMHQIKTRL